MRWQPLTYIPRGGPEAKHAASVSLASQATQFIK